MEKIKIGIIGMGYVGLPLAVEFKKCYEVVGFDINEARIDQLNKGIDLTLEVDKNDLLKSSNLIFTSKSSLLASCNYYIITVPTPVDNLNNPDLSLLLSASEIVAKHLKKNDIVIYESTVFPGCTEEICAPLIEKISGLKFNFDFFCGYSPERINPGDKKHRLRNIIKVTSGSTLSAADSIDRLYASIVDAGTFKAESIKVAEAAKIIENTQRDINIALMNECAIIFNKLGIDTNNVLEAANTKWNFLDFKPGLVGGHCIGVDPYYLTYKARSIGWDAKVILAGRKLNDSMGYYVSNQLVLKLDAIYPSSTPKNILIMGLSFKENCPDIRNSKVFDVYQTLKKFNLYIDVYDPMVNIDESIKEYGIHLIQEPKQFFYHAIILAVAHNQFIEMGPKKIRSFGLKNSLLFDVKSIFKAEESDLRL